MSEESISQEFRLESIDQTRNCFIEEINQNELMSKKHKKICRVLNYSEHLLVLISTVSEGVYIIYICFFNWYPYSYYELCNIIKNLCNNCRN